MATRTLRKRGLLKRSLKTRRRSAQPPSLFLPEADYSDSSVFEDIQEKHADHAGDESKCKVCLCTNCQATGKNSTTTTQVKQIEVNRYNGYLVTFDHCENGKLTKQAARDTMIISKTVEFSSETEGSVQSARFLANRRHRMTGYKSVPLKETAIKRLQPFNQRKKSDESISVDGAASLAPHLQAATSFNHHSNPAVAFEDPSIVPLVDDIILRNRYEVRSNFENLSNVRLQSNLLRGNKPKKKTFLARLRSSWFRLTHFNRKAKKRKHTRQLFAAPAVGRSNFYNRSKSEDKLREDEKDEERRNSWSFQEMTSHSCEDSSCSDGSKKHATDIMLNKSGTQRDGPIRAAHSAAVQTPGAANKERSNHLRQTKVSNSSVDSGLEEYDCLSSTEMASTSQQSGQQISSAQQRSAYRAPPPTQRYPVNQSKSTYAGIISTGHNGRPTNWSKTNMGKELGYFP